ncbi:branched-chain amino acid ABC transporter permease [Bradyrhizobium australafricanum]|uniref:branched-chain amino acid ABC transporter permease n=1 Tax=Bradyrhizobium australafricanum TaxID=2821406 RepID=UPI001CE33A4E|nr:branched-chain amino acid ABC transporter permease [Bradyrhizobium australafricanum]MCA6100520.1 branched-chain amino acid ABC transporter permease [Bradyrhizobium australafricanum]
MAELDTTSSLPHAPLALSTDRPRNRLVVVAVATLAGSIALPFVLDQFFIFQVTMVMIYAIAILGLNLLTGFNGQLSLGHGAFYAIGAYTAAILMGSYDVAYFWTLPIAAIVCFIFGFLFGLPSLRLDRAYLALATFALSVATPQILKFSLLEHWTGGVQGLVITKPDAPFDLPLSQDQWLYFFTLAVAILMYVLAINLIRTRTGRAMMAIRDNPLAARSMGINNSIYKASTFGVSGLYTGVAGALGAIVVQFVAPDSFTVSLSIALLVGLVVGGVGWLPGALFGAAFILFVPNAADQISKGLSGAAYGLMLIALMLVMPGGFAGAIRLASLTLRKRRA